MAEKTQGRLRDTRVIKKVYVYVNIYAYIFINYNIWLYIKHTRAHAHTHTSYMESRMTTKSNLSLEEMYILRL